MSHYNQLQELENIVNKYIDGFVVTYSGLDSTGHRYFGILNLNISDDGINISFTISSPENTGDLNSYKSKKYVIPARSGLPCKWRVVDGVNGQINASQVAEEVNRRFMTDAERTAISSLGTYAKKDFSNVTVKSLGLNGYYKLPDGLMIQWGYSNSSGSKLYIYFPTSFMSEAYSITTGITGGSATDSALSIILVDRYSSYFSVRGTISTNDKVHNNPLFWIAIGRWK